MNILQTPVRFYPYTGGVESHVHSLSKELVDLGHEVKVLCARTDGTERREQIDGVDVHRLASVGQIAQTNLTPQFPVEVLRLARWADVVHTHLPTPWNADLSAMAGKLTRTPVVLTYHNDIVGEGIADLIARTYNRTMLQATLRSVDRIITTQEAYVDSSPHLPRYRDKVTTIPNGVDIDRFRPVPDTDQFASEYDLDPAATHVAFLSVLDAQHEYKGLDVLIDAMHHLEQRDGPTPQLLVGGSGELQSEYRQRAEEMGMTDRVRFLGFVPEDSLVDFYNFADGFVLPSTSAAQEGFGLVLLEALACGTPVVTTDVVGVSQHVQNQPIGTIVEQDNSESLANGVERVLSADDYNSEQLRSVSTSDYSWNQISKEVEKLYKNHNR